MSYAFTIIGVKKDAISIANPQGQQQKVMTKIILKADNYDDAIKKAKGIITLESYQVAEINEIIEKTK